MRPRSGAQKQIRQRLRHIMGNQPAAQAVRKALAAVFFNHRPEAMNPAIARLPDTMSQHHE